MKTLFLLQGDYPTLAKQEIIALSKKTKKQKKEFLFEEERVVVCDTALDFSRLAYTKKVYAFLFETTVKKLRPER